MERYGPNFLSAMGQLLSAPMTATLGQGDGQLLIDMTQIGAIATSTA